MESSNDHDTLIRVETNVKNLIDEVRLLRDGTKEDIATLFKQKADAKIVEDLRKDFNESFKKHADADEAIQSDLNKRTARLEKWVYVGIGIIVTLQFITIIVSNQRNANQDMNTSTMTRTSTTQSPQSVVQ